MQRMIRSIFVLFLLGIFTVAYAQLPPEVRLDKHLIKAELLRKAGKHQEALKVMKDSVLALTKKDSLKLPDDFHFKYARVALSADSIKIALESVTRYLSATGRGGEFYKKALALLIGAEEHEEGFYLRIIFFHKTIYWVGVVFSGYFALWCFSRLIRWIFIKKTGPKIRPKDMPILRPIPIPTKGRKIFARLIVWMAEPRRWRVMEDWCFRYKKKNGKTIKLVIPKGFEFDGASIPRILWFFLHPTGLLLIPGLIHDYGYKYDQLWKLNANGAIVPFPKPPKNGRLYWDSLFRKIGMQVNGVWLPNFLAWLAVVCFGCCAWRKHKKGDRKKAKKPQTAGQCSPSQGKIPCGK